MNCEYVKQNALLMVYDELADDARFEMERHIERCADCAREVEGARHFRAARTVVPVEEPTANLLAASRMRLQEALETAEQKRGLGRFTFDFARFLGQLKLAPAAAMALLVVGFLGGSVATWQLARARGGVQPIAATVEPAQQDASVVAGVNSIEQVPGTNNVAIKYDKVQHAQAQGALSDPAIQQLLLFAAHNNLNSGLRMQAANVLAQSPDDEHVRDSLVYSLRYDTNPGVRLKAIEVLAPYVTSDEHVRNAVLEALMNDNSPGVRIEAMHAAEKARADSSVRRVLAELAKDDHNEYIRRKAQEVLNTTTID